MSTLTKQNLASDYSKFQVQSNQGCLCALHSWRCSLMSLSITIKILYWLSICQVLRRQWRFQADQDRRASSQGFKLMSYKKVEKVTLHDRECMPANLIWKLVELSCRRISQMGCYMACLEIFTGNVESGWGHLLCRGHITIMITNSQLGPFLVEP